VQTPAQQALAPLFAEIDKSICGYGIYLRVPRDYIHSQRSVFIFQLQFAIARTPQSE